VRRAGSGEHSQIELTKTLAVADRFHPDDLSVRDCEFQNHQQLSARSHDDADFAVDERGLASLLVAIGTINVWNRLNVATRQVAFGRIPEAAAR
jgi:alkylhydroperoxidase family enzyme